MSHKTLFLQQSYIDCTNQYTALLEAPNLPLWDYVILTASNEEQAASYRTQIQYRLEHHMIPESTHYAVLPDPDGKRVGSGGATLNVLRYVHENAGSFENQRILVIHSGGDSKRVPQYSACGKLFSPVPRVLPNGKRSTLFDEFMISMSGVAARMNAGMLVCSGDVLLLFNPLQIDFYGKGAAALSIKEPAEIGKNHGVYRVDSEGNVGGFLHKKTVEQLQKLGASDDQGNVDIDTGAVIFNSEMLQALYQLVDTKEKFAAYVNESTRLSFYADFLYPLASDSTLEQYYKETPEGDFTPELEQCRTELWSVLHPYQMKLIRMSPAAFIHFGTTKELRELMTERMDEFYYLGWTSNINTNREEADFAASNSYVSPNAEIGKGSYLEDCMIRNKSQIGEECVISGVTLDGQTIPAHTVLHGLKQQNGKFVVRMYGVSDNPKEALLFGKTLPMPLWEAAIYPVCDSMEEAVHQTLEAWREGFPIREDAISLKDSFNQADLSALMPWQEKVSDKVELEEILEAIDRKENLTRLVEQMRDGISERVKGELLKEAQRLSETELDQFSRKIRIYYVLSCFDEKYMDSCFATISSGILAGAVKGLCYDADAKMGKDQVTVNLPVRVNWGGGWSDTPPYCMEHGGTVLNAAVMLDGNCPIEVVVKKVDEPVIVLASADSGAEQTFTDIYDDSMWLINLVENLLAVTRIEGGQVNLTRSIELMDEVVSEALKHINRKSKEHTIRVTSGKDFILAHIDAKLIVQVIINLVDNAIKYTPAGSVIEIHTEQKNKWVIVSVADNGPGIPDEQKPRVFDMFYSGANKVVDSRRSLGLGLSLCKSIVTAHGGTISVSDNQPNGTVFTFTLPAGEVELHE